MIWMSVYLAHHFSSFHLFSSPSKTTSDLETLHPAYIRTPRFPQKHPHIKVNEIYQDRYGVKPTSRVPYYGRVDGQSPCASRPASVPSSPAPPFSLVLVGLKQHDRTEVTFCALEISKFGPGELYDALKDLIYSTICGDIDPDTVDINRKFMHWTSTAIIFGILRLAAGRGMGDILMVDYAID